MKKFFSIQLVAMSFALLTGCSGNTQTRWTQNKNQSIYLVHFLDDNGFSYYYDRDTKVIYCDSWSSRGYVFVLLDREGKPRIYKPLSHENK